jgi:hypothetical protein
LLTIFLFHSNLPEASNKLIVGNEEKSPGNNDLV